MPAYSFKERFVPMVKDGSKPGTVRAFRKYRVKPGQLAHLFYGMRTKFCTKLAEPSPPVKEVYCIFISEDGDMALIDVNWLDEDQRRIMLQYGTKAARRLLLTKGKKELDAFFDGKVKWLSAYEKDVFAWQDGFRFKEIPEEKRGCFNMMIRFWQMTHQLPFVGNYSLWGTSLVPLRK